MLDAEETVGRGEPHAVYMRWGDGSGFLVLSQTLGRERAGRPPRPHQVGLPHFLSWGVD